MVKCCSKYSARDLREPVTFERLTRTADGAGGHTEAWAAISGAPDRGMVKALSGRERWSSQRLEGIVSHRVVVRYFAGINEGDRVTIRNRPCNIRFVNNVDFADKWLELDVEMGVAT